jgi:ParB-like chromosome segregation protein Spo0J
MSDQIKLSEPFQISIEEIKHEPSVSKCNPSPQLIESIRTRGQLLPLFVVKVSDPDFNYQLISGAHRLKVLQDLQETKVTVRAMEECTPEEILRLRLESNLIRG